MRGKRTHAGYRPRGVRITPAGAGKTRVRRYRAAERADHPRRCGENGSNTKATQEAQGSPPQVRGKLLSMICGSASTRITPAGAGKTATPRARFVVSWDHPRRCGENSNIALAKSTRIGSPPQVRGKPLVSFCAVTSARITPAGAGKTPTPLRNRLKAADHPRRCGENAPRLCRSARRGGSPPQVRGKPAYRRCTSPHPRITPAGAGKTAMDDYTLARKTDHPRRCGENAGYRPRGVLHRGSPPQVRGKRPFCVLGRSPSRITPAGAGKTLSRIPLRRHTADHPRRCGENDWRDFLTMQTNGSPPQVRGKLFKVG